MMRNDEARMSNVEQREIPMAVWLEHSCLFRNSAFVIYSVYLWRIVSEKFTASSAPRFRLRHRGRGERRQIQAHTFAKIKAGIARCRPITSDLCLIRVNLWRKVLDESHRNRN